MYIYNDIYIHIFIYLNREMLCFFQQGTFRAIDSEQPFCLVGDCKKSASRPPWPWPIESLATRRFENSGFTPWKFK